MARTLGFAALVRERGGDRLDAWLADVAACAHAWG